MLYGCQVAVQLRPVLQLQTQRVASPITGRKADSNVGRMLVLPTNLIGVNDDF